jgi:hypothetical protein
MFNEDNSGYVFFPINAGRRLTIISDIKTLIYLVAFEPKKPGDISNVTISSPGDFVSDDVSDRLNYNDVLKNQSANIEYDRNYFPFLSKSDIKSILMVSSICIGWSDNTYEIDGEPWKATYRDLTDEGQRLYYTLKKLHNNKEIRILTFNNI